MRIVSDNWNDDIDFEKISFVHFIPGKSDKDEQRIVIASVGRNEGAFKIAMFFKYVANIVISSKNRQVYRNKRKLGHFQFELSNEEYPAFAVKWFTLSFDNGIEIKHDIAFNTTYIHKNGHRVFFSGREKKSGKYSKYLELKMKKRAYTYIANQILK